MPKDVDCVEIGEARIHLREHCSLVQLLRSFLEILRIPSIKRKRKNKVEQVLVLSTQSLCLGLVVLLLKSILSLKKEKKRIRCHSSVQ